MKMIRLIKFICSSVVLSGLFISTHVSASVTNVETSWSSYVDPGTGDVHLSGSPSYADGPTLKVFTTDGSGFGFTLEEIITNSDTMWTGWHEELLVSDGSGGWIPSTSGDGLNFGNAGLYTPSGLATENPIGAEAITFIFDDPLYGGYNVELYNYIYVPAGMTTFALAQAPTVPIPAAVWLFGSGLIGLIGVARRKKA